MPDTERVDTHVLVLAGGGGTRLWPQSRGDVPKFLLRLGDAEPLVMDAVRRALRLTGPERVHVVTSARYAEATRAVTARLGVTSLVIEPDARDTAAAIALGNATVAAHTPDAVVVALPADQTIRDDDNWGDAMERLVGAAKSHALACVGLRPLDVNTGFGYVHAPVSGGTPTGPRQARYFHEKPDRQTAARYVSDGDFFWSVSIMAWRAATFDTVMSEHAPQIAEAARRVAAAGPGDPAAAATWRAAPRISIEHALLEPAAAAGQVTVVPADLPTWSDLGTWSSLADSAAGHPVPEWLLSHDATNCFVTQAGTAGRRYALLGVSDLIVVDCGDVVMIANRDEAQRVREVVRQLATKGWDDLL